MAQAPWPRGYNAAMTTGRSGQNLGETFLSAIRERNWAVLAATFAPDARFQAVVDNEATPFRDHVGGEAAAAQIARWFDDADVHEVVSGGVESIGDRVHVWYRIRGHDADGWSIVEQHAFGDPTADGAGFRRVVLACSGFRPVEAPRSRELKRSKEPTQRSAGANRHE